MFVLARRYTPFIQSLQIVFVLCVCFKEEKLGELIPAARLHALENIDPIVLDSKDKNDCVDKMEKLVDDFVDDFIKNDPFFKDVPERGVTALKRELKPQFIEAFVTSIFWCFVSSTGRGRGANVYLQADIKKCYFLDRQSIICDVFWSLILLGIGRCCSVGTIFCNSFLS